jgi:hypothetical protein
MSIGASGGSLSAGLPWRKPWELRYRSRTRPIVSPPFSHPPQPGPPSATTGLRSVPIPSIVIAT